MQKNRNTSRSTLYRDKSVAVKGSLRIAEYSKRDLTRE